jgi:hypothetical protein
MCSVGGKLRRQPKQSKRIHVNPNTDPHPNANTNSHPDANSHPNPVVNHGSESRGDHASGESLV